VRGKIRVLLMLGLSLALLGCAPGNDYGGQTGYDYLLRCQLVVRGPRTDREIVSATYCVAAVSALVGVAPLLPPRDRFCFPDDVTAGEAVQVVVAYLESNLTRLDEDFRPLAIAAMKQAWPCRYPPPPGRLHVRP
jgi:Ssp1 endopeptidase immunity protein Rap1a